MLENAIQRQWFRGAVGQQMFCHVGQCRSILDCRRAVEITITDTATDTIRQCAFYCAQCFDKADLATLTRDVLEPDGLSLDVIDGRTLFSPTN